MTVEDRKRADLRILALLQTPAQVRFLSCEPLLSELDHLFEFYLSWQDAWGHPQIKWMIVGGESGPGARPMELAWATDLIEECRDAGVACFVKQLGSVWAAEAGHGGKGSLPEQWPPNLRVRMYPGQQW